MIVVWLTTVSRMLLLSVLTSNQSCVDIVAGENGCAYITGSGGNNVSDWDMQMIEYADTANVNGIGISLSWQSGQNCKEVKYAAK